MNALQERRRLEIEHYQRSGRLRAYCCGCIHSESNCIFVCLIWAGFSFYFAVLAFMGKSPFYSYLQDPPLVAFGAINLLFGIVTLCSMVVFIVRINSRWGRMMRMQGQRFDQWNTSKTIVYAITANALAVLAVTLAVFVLFVIDKSGFTSRCSQESAGFVRNVYQENNQDNINNATVSNINSTATPSNTDIYNCERLFEDNIKWALLCMIVMFIVYIHWILIIAAKRSYNFYHRTPMVQIGSEFGNIAPSRKRGNKINVFNNMKPSKSIWKEFLVHRQYGEFINGSTERDVMNNNTNTTEKINVGMDAENNFLPPKDIAAPGNAFLSNA